MRKQIDLFTQNYIICALWSSLDEYGDPLDDEYTLHDFTPDTLEQIIAECELFQFLTSPYLDLKYTENNGHDFWLTRHHHGAGFWDRDYYGEINSKELTTIAHSFGECNLYITEDDHIAIA